VHRHQGRTGANKSEQKKGGRGSRGNRKTGAERKVFGRKKKDIGVFWVKNGGSQQKHGWDKVSNNNVKERTHFKNVHWTKIRGGGSETRRRRLWDLYWGLNASLTKDGGQVWKGGQKRKKKGGEKKKEHQEKFKKDQNENYQPGGSLSEKHLLKKKAQGKKTGGDDWRAGTEWTPDSKSKLIDASRRPCDEKGREQMSPKKRGKMLHSYRAKGMCIGDFQRKKKEERGKINMWLKKGDKVPPGTIWSKKEGNKHGGREEGGKTLTLPKQKPKRGVLNAVEKEKSQA